jgi:hypothetical protein
MSRYLTQGLRLLHRRTWGRNDAGRLRGIAPSAAGHVHHATKLVKRWLAAHPRVQVLHGARYSPHDNPVERIWGALKAWLANSPTLTIQGRVRQVHAFFAQRSRAQLLTTAAPHTSPWLPEGYLQAVAREAA